MDRSAAIHQSSADVFVPTTEIGSERTLAPENAIGPQAGSYVITA